MAPVQKKQSEGLSVKTYLGDGSVMFGMDLDEKQTTNLAGFAIQCAPPAGKPFYLPNRINFTTPVTSKSQPHDADTGSDTAPFQKFRWMHFPQDPGKYQYEVSTMYFGNGKTGSLTQGPSAKANVSLGPLEVKQLEVGFTRGFLTSQAYADQFKNKPIRPAQKTITYDTKPYAQQYQWLGFHARKMVFDFLDECVKDKSITVDMFAYDLDEPDFIRGLQALGGRLRAYLDNAPLHTKAGAAEIDAAAALKKSAGESNVEQGHFQRFSHDKILIQKKNGKAVKVLTGSANFSVRGLYVQANNVLVFDDPQTAGLYAQVFQAVFTNAKDFHDSALAKNWNDLDPKVLPVSSVAFSPHNKPAFSLQRPSQAIQNAKSSVFFAVMQLGGGGPVMQALNGLNSQNKVFWYGMTQAAIQDAKGNIQTKGIKISAPGSKTDGILATFSALSKYVPKPFLTEWAGGMGQVIHHKFVVTDFNTSSPLVVTGSSNLAEGGEESNGDNMLCIQDPEIATAYAIEAIRLVDHYHFRCSMTQATASKPINLDGPGSQQPWWKDYFDPSTLKFRDRQVFG